MRIMHVTSLFAPDRVGGAEVFVEDLARTQAASGQIVAVATTSRQLNPVAKDNALSVYRLGHTTPFFVLDWSQQPAWKQKYYKFAVQADWGIAKRLAAAIEDFRPDVINTHSLSEFSPLIWHMIAVRGIPLVHTLHDFSSICTNGSLFHDGHICDGKRILCRSFAYLHRRLQKGVGAVVGVGSDIIDRHLKANMFTHVPTVHRRVIWNAVPEPQLIRRRQAPAIDAPVVFGYLARLEAAKGADTLIEATKSLPPDGWRLVMAGHIPDASASYVESAVDLPITFPGYVDAGSFFNEIDCLIVPPIWPEAFGRTVAEACLRGIPVIGSDIAGVAEQINAFGAGTLFVAGNAEMLAARMREMVEERGRLLVIGSNAARFAEGVRPQFVANAYCDLYDSLCSAKNHTN